MRRRAGTLFADFKAEDPETSVRCGRDGRSAVQHIEDIFRNAVIFFRRWGWWPMSGWLDAFARQGLIRYVEGTQRWILVDPR